MIARDKKIASHVLKQPRTWIESKTNLPENAEPVVIRLCHDTLSAGESETEIYPLEDIKVGYFDSNLEKWIIMGPHPKYDFSKLSSKGDIKDHVDVTHWATLDEGELQGWNTRFDRSKSYGLLELRVDEENEKEVYRALLHGSAYIHTYGDPEMKPLAEILYDLQHCIDFGNNNNTPSDK
jgi:hypothetical protein